MGTIGTKHGKVRVRARAEIEELPKGKQQIVITEIPARPEQANPALGNRQHVGQQLEPFPGSVAGRPDNQLPDAARHESRQAHRPDESPGQDAATKTIKNSNNKELHKNGRKSTGKCG